MILVLDFWFCFCWKLGNFDVYYVLVVNLLIGRIWSKNFESYLETQNYQNYYLAVYDDIFMLEKYES